MKELTIEQKAKAYDNIIEKANKMNSENCEACQICIEELIPELRESEDEKIRMSLIELFKDMEWDDSILHDYNMDKGKTIAWLEKQGESIKIEKGKNYLCTKTHKYAGVEWIEGVKYYSPEDYSLVNEGCTCYCPKYSKEEHNNFFKEVEYDDCLETDKAEPKFHKGEWITIKE